MPVILRFPTEDDIPALANLGRESFVTKFGMLYHDEDLLPFLEKVFSETSIAAQMADPNLIYQIADNGERLLGYCKLSRTPGFREYARGTRPIEVKQLYTASDATGLGIGGALMEWAIATARAEQADEMQLSVWSRNFDGQRFYSRYGFSKVADVHFKVGEQLDEEFLFALML